MLLTQRTIGEDTTPIRSTALETWEYLFGVGAYSFSPWKAAISGFDNLSKNVSPPHKWSCWKTIVGGLIGLMVLEFALGYAHTLLGYGGNFEQQLSWLGWWYFGFLVFALGLVVWYNSRVFPKRCRIWDRSVMCRRCGHVIQVEGPAPSQTHLIQEARR